MASVHCVDFATDVCVWLPAFARDGSLKPPTGSKRPEANARQRDAPSGALSVWRVPFLRLREGDERFDLCPANGKSEPVQGLKRKPCSTACRNDWAAFSTASRAAARSPRPTSI